MILNMVRNLGLNPSKITERRPIYPSEELSLFLLEDLPFDYFCIYLNLPVHYEDFDHDFAFNVLNFKLQDDELFTNYPLDWQETYFEQELQFKDPVLTHAKNVFSPFFWGDFDQDNIKQHRNLPKLKSPSLKTLINNSQNYGISCGLSIPLNYGAENIGVLTLASDSLSRSFNYFELAAICSYAKSVGDYFAFYQKGTTTNKLDTVKVTYNITKYQQLLSTKKALLQHGILNKD